MSEVAENTDDFDIEIEGEEEIAIEVVDTTPDGDKGKQLLAPEKETLEEPDDDEIASYSERVQKRIKDATFKFHDQRRKREAAEREREEAVKFAQEALKKAQQLEAAVYQYEAGYVDQAKTRVGVELAQAQADLKAAFEVGNADKMAEAQAKIAKLSVQEDQFSRFKPRQAAEPEDYKPQVQNKTADEDAKRYQAWVEKNPWFEQDDTLKDFAMGIHARLAVSDPDNVGSEDYYNEIEKRVKTAFPAKFKTTETEGSRTKAPPVAAVSRNTGSDKARKTIRLTREQMALCRRLGITPQDYVREMAKNGE